MVLNFLLAQARKYDPRIIFFDKDRGAELFLRAIGGRYDVLRAGEPSGLNPLLLEDTAENRQFLLAWLSRLVSEPGRSLPAEDLARLKDAVDANMAAPVAFRRLEHFSQLLHGDQRPHAGDLRSRLAPWWGDGRARLAVRQSRGPRRPRRARHRLRHDADPRRSRPSARRR